MLSYSDYCSLKRSVRGWTAERLRFHGEPWPPVHGWRKRLLKQYETGIRVAPPPPPVAKIRSSKTPNLHVRLRSLLERQRTLSAAYWGISSNQDFAAEERHYYGLQLEKMEYEIRHLQQEAKRG